MWSCNATANEHEGEKCELAHGLECFKGTLDVSTLNYVPSSSGIPGMLLRSAQIGRR